MVKSVKFMMLYARMTATFGHPRTELFVCSGFRGGVVMGVPQRGRFLQLPWLWGDAGLCKRGPGLDSRRSISQVKDSTQVSSAFSLVQRRLGT